MVAKEGVSAGERDLARERLLERDDRNGTWKEPRSSGRRGDSDRDYEDWES
jgi:hypothetical protein